MNTDPFVRKSMKVWNREVYDSLAGYTKKATLPVALDTLFKYSRAERSKSSIPADKLSKVELAVQRTRQKFIPSEKLIRYSLSEGVDSMALDTSAGYSYPGKLKSEVVEQAYDVAAYMQHRLQRGNTATYAPPCKLALRGHLSSEDEVKTRPVWVYPFEVSILEAKWAIPFYQYLEKSVETVHFGKDAMPRLAKMLNASLGGYDESGEVTLDWSSFDATIPCWMINEAFNIIWDSFDNNFAYHEGSNVFGGEKMVEKNWNLFKWIRQYFLKTKIMLPDGTVIRKEHGIPSGSFFTQAVGSIVNCIAIEFLNLEFGWQMRRLRILGDDSSFIVPMLTTTKVVPSDIKECAWRIFGLVLKEDKVRIASSQPGRKFLGYQVNGYRFVRKDKDWLLMVLYPERDVESLEQSASRVWAYYLLGGCNSEIYCNFLHDYLGRYPAVVGKRFILSRGMKRLFKYVLRADVDAIRAPDPRKLLVTEAPYLLSRGVPVFDSS